MKVRSTLLCMVISLILASMLYAKTVKVSDLKIEPGKDNSAVINTAIKELPEGEQNQLVLDTDVTITKSIMVIDKDQLTISGKGILSPVEGTDTYTFITVRDTDQLTLKGFTIDGKKCCTRATDIMRTTSTTIDGITVKNIGDKNKNTNVSAISFNHSNYDFQILNCIVERIEAAKSSTGISVSNSRDLSKHNARCLIKGNRISYVSPVKDADGIRLLNKGYNGHFVIESNVLAFCDKRGIKTQTNYVLSKDNVIIDAFFCGIGFQTGNNCESINDTVIFTKKGSKPYYGILFWANQTNGKLQGIVKGAKIVDTREGVLRDFPIGIKVHADDKCKAWGGMLIEGCTFERITTPISIYCDELDTLNVFDCTFLDCISPYSISLGGYQSAGKHYYPKLTTLRFTDNRILQKGYLETYSLYEKDGNKSEVKREVIRDNQVNGE